MNNTPVERDLLPSRSRPVSPSRGGAAVRRLFCCGLIVIGIGALVYARPDPGSSPNRSAGPTPGSPLWSPRRVPQSVVEAAGAQRLAGDLAGAVRDVEGHCVLVDLPGLGVITSLQPDRPLIGASAQKLFTAHAGLAVLGPDYRYVTRVVTRTPVSGQSVDTVWFVGGGDPLLQTPDYRTYLDDRPSTRGTVGTPLQALADRIAATGVRSIGTLSVDDSRYDQVRFLPTWRANYRTEGQVGSLGALLVNSGFETFRPERVPAQDPALAAGTALADLLRERGVSVGSVARGTPPPAGPDLAAVESPPFREIAAELLKVSDNTTAELVTRELAVKQGRPGTTEAGAAAMSERLGSDGVPMKDVRILDGSGLSRDNRLTCSALAAVLESGRVPGPEQLDDLLAVAGTSGTLALRFTDTPLADRLEAKTGNLNGVTALAGYVDTYRQIPFAFVANGEFGEAEGVGLQNRIAGVIGRYPSGLDAEAIVPAPKPPCTAPDCR